MALCMAFCPRCEGHGTDVDTFQPPSPSMAQLHHEQCDHLGRFIIDRPCAVCHGVGWVPWTTFMRENGREPREEDFRSD